MNLLPNHDEINVGFFQLNPKGTIESMNRQAKLLLNLTDHTTDNIFNMITDSKIKTELHKCFRLRQVLVGIFLEC